MALLIVGSILMMVILWGLWRINSDKAPEIHDRQYYDDLATAIEEEKRRG